MKTKLTTILLMALMCWGGTTTTRASEDALMVTGDVVIARPACLLATLVGTVIFVVALPIAATSGSVHDTADALVKQPAAATFTRPLGDFSSLR
jgi:hypothetical protein